MKTKTGMPANVGAERMGHCDAPTLVIAAQLDYLFPARKVLPRAKAIVPNCASCELAGREHMHVLTDAKKAMIVNFLA